MNLEREVKAARSRLVRTPAQTTEAARGYLKILSDLCFKNWHELGRPTGGLVTAILKEPWEAALKKAQADAATAQRKAESQRKALEALNAAHAESQAEIRRLTGERDSLKRALQAAHPGAYREWMGTVKTARPYIWIPEYQPGIITHQWGSEDRAVVSFSVSGLHIEAGTCVTFLTGRLVGRRRSCICGTYDIRYRRQETAAQNG